MAPKKATTAAPKKTATASHGSYKDMIKEAIVALKERSGSSRQAIKKYIQANNKLGNTTDAALSKYISGALASGEKSGEFLRPKGPSGPVKLGQKKAKTTTKSTTTKTAKPKTTTAKKPAAAKKTKTTTTKKAAPKTKANVSKPRKSAPKKPAPAPAVAVEEKKPVVLGKTKSGRVTKSKAPETAPKPKKAGVRKIGATKKATPKKVEA